MLPLLQRLAGSGGDVVSAAECVLTPAHRDGTEQAWTWPETKKGQRKFRKGEGVVRKSAYGG
jgi:hypothetical protein